ncbi:uncharacterized protein [Branchiostoma lanceolatum]|uniref:uncharacterized protein n=1 Tax=Branchiostoma lanceolatum TaxID=7740 RepID=UPI003454B0C5
MTTRKLAGEFQQVDKPFKDKDGNTLATTQEQLRRWAEHFNELLYRRTPEAPPDCADIPPADSELPINVGKPAKVEIKKAIMSLRNGKGLHIACNGVFQGPPASLKADIVSSVNMLHSLISRIWDEEQVPAGWREGILVKLPKKRGLTGKVFNRIFLEKMRNAVDIK